MGNFLTNWHGNDNSAAFALAFSFDLSSLVMLVVFGGIALGIIVAKVAMVVMIALLIVAMVASLWIGPGSARLASYAKFYVGLAVFTFAISAVVALLNLITGFLVGAGARQFGPGSILAVLWSGFAPVTAVVVLHLLFKHVLRVPSPFKPSGALAYAGSIGGIGAAAGAGFDRLVARARYRGEYRARQFAGSGFRNMLGARTNRGQRSGTGSMPMRPPPPLKQLAAERRRRASARVDPTGAPGGLAVRPDRAAPAAGQGLRRHQEMESPDQRQCQCRVEPVLPAQPHRPRGSRRLGQPGRRGHRHDARSDRSGRAARGGGHRRAGPLPAHPGQCRPHQVPGIRRRGVAGTAVASRPDRAGRRWCHAGRRHRRRPAGRRCRGTGSRPSRTHRPPQPCTGPNQGAGRGTPGDLRAEPASVPRQGAAVTRRNLAVRSTSRAVGPR